MRKPDVEAADLPIDPDSAEAQPAPSPFAHPRRSAWPKMRADVIGAVFVGGCIGGLLRYAAVSAWPTPNGRFPWSTLTVNIAGAFILALVVVIAAEVVPSRYLRPLLGTGFCGALTTFSSVAVSADQLFAHGQAGTAVGYLLATGGAGLAAAALGLVAGRALPGSRLGHRSRNDRTERSSA